MKWQEFTIFNAVAVALLQKIQAQKKSQMEMQDTSLADFQTAKQMKNIGRLKNKEVKSEIWEVKR